MFQQLKVAALKCDARYWECQGEKTTPSGQNRQSTCSSAPAKSGSKPDHNIQCCHNQSHQSTLRDRWQAHARGTGALLPQGPLLLLWYCHQLAYPRLLQFPTPQPAAVGCTTFTVTGETEVTIEEVIGGPLTKSEKLTCDPSPQVCNLDSRGYSAHFTAVDKIPDPFLDLVRISSTLTSHSEVSFLISLTLPGLSDLYLHSSIREPPQISWTHLWLLCQPLYWNPWIFQSHCASSMASLQPPGFIHESVNISVSFADCSTQSLSLLVMKAAPIRSNRPWPSMVAKHQSDDRTVGPLTHFQNRPSSALPLLALARACSTATLHHEDIISDLPPVFDSIPELCNSSGPLIPTGWSRSQN